MGRIEQARQINDIFNGKMSVNDAHNDVQTWFELTAHNLAVSIVDAPNENRKDIAEMVSKEWRDDVLPLVRKIIKSQL